MPVRCNVAIFQTASWQTIPWVVLVLVLGWARMATTHDLDAHDRKSVVTSDKREQSVTRVQELLTAVHPLRQSVDTTSETDVKTTVLCYCLTKAPEAVRELRRLAAKRFVQGMTAWQAHRLQDAIAAFTKTLQLHPRNTWAYVNRGLAYARLGQYVQAQADFSSALAVDSQLTAAYYARGLVSILLGQVAQADGDIQRAAALGAPEAREVLQTFVYGAPAPAASGSLPAD
jgi:tetratricopeptide (TPR) repeat protein